jgi:uncharacterized protein (TIGR02646 family)
MIPLKRKRTASAIKTKFRGAGKQAMDRELLKAQREFLRDPSRKHVFKSAYWKSAKVQLKKESNGKCAYCEANTEIVAYGDVEHYRPKSIYWWLAYTYDNFLYCCQICNQTYKRNNFPFSETPFPPPTLTHSATDDEIEQLTGNISPDPLDINSSFTFQRYLSDHHAQGAHLINPYFDDPAKYFKYEADDITKEVRVIPANPQCNEVVRAAEEFYGINRIELKNARYAIFNKLKIFHLAYQAITDGEIRTEIELQVKEMLSDRYIFAGMNRYFKEIFNSNQL